MITAKVEGLNQLHLKLAMMEIRLDEALEESLVKAAKPIEDYAVGAAPIRTGALARSIITKPMKSAAGHAQVRIGPKWAVFGSHRVEYGRFQEFGTSKMAAQPFMRPAFDVGWPQAFRMFRAEMKRRLT